MKSRITLKILVIVLAFFTSAYSDVGVQKDYSTRQGLEMAGSLCGGLITGINVYNMAEAKSNKSLAGVGIGSGLLLVGAAFSSEVQYPIVLALSGTVTIASGVFAWRNSMRKNLKISPVIILNDDHKSLLGLHVSFRF